MSSANSWITRTNVYEVNLRQYTPEGTFDAFAAHLPRLREMGVETLWFMPVTPIAQRNKKGSMGSYYACSDYTAVSPEFGTLDDWKELVRRARAMGFRVILDWVANHTGWDHRWTWEHPEWYERDPHTGDFRAAHGMDDIIELNFGHPELRKAMIEAMRFWVAQTGIDGFRCDLAFWVEQDFWVEARAAIDPERKLFWLGELDPLEHPHYMEVFDAAYTWSWMHGMQEFMQQRQPRSRCYELLRLYSETRGIPAWFTSNHDENTWNGTEHEKYGPLASALAVFSCTWPGLPLLYSGQELPNRKRLQFFEKDGIDWSGGSRLHHFYRTLLDLRRRHPGLACDAPCSLLSGPEEPVLVYRRGTGEDAVLVYINLTGEAQPVDVDLWGTRLAFREVLSGMHGQEPEGMRYLMPWGCWVLEKQ